MRKLYYLAAIAITSTLAVGCGHKAIQPTFDQIETDTVFHVANTNYNITYDFATITNTDESPALKAIEEANIAYFFGLEGFTGSAHEAIPQAIAMTVESSFDTADNEREWSAEASITSCAAIVDTLISYTITASGYLGGAHSYYSTTSHNYSIEGGYELSLADIFSPAQLNKLTEIIRQELYRQYNASNDSDLVAQGFFPEYISVSENFEVSPDGIIFHYNPYDIGCYALGGIDIEIDKAELSAL